jgi:hypothetical protein
VAAWALLFEKNKIRIPMIIYGTHVATTVVPIMSELIFSPDLSSQQLYTLLAFYLPYLLVPVALVVEFSMHSQPFASSADALRGKIKKCM